QAASVVAEGLFDEFALFDTMMSLVDKSLVAVEYRGPSQRFRLMEPLRQYALALLKECGELEATALQHALYFSTWTQREGSKYQQVPDLTFVATIEEEIDNIRAALEWALVKGNDPVLGAELASNVGGFWFTQHYHEGLRWLEAAGAAVTYEGQMALSVRIAIFRMRAFIQTDLNKTLQIGEAAEGSVRALGDGVVFGRFAVFYGGALVQVDRLDEGEAILQEGLAWSERLDDPYRIAFILLNLARLNRKRGRLDVARALSRRMVEVYERCAPSGDRNRWIVWSQRASFEEYDGRIGRAIELCREAYGDTELAKDTVGGVQIEYYLGVLLLRSGNLDEARLHGRSVLSIGREEALPHAIDRAIQLLSGVAAHTGRYELAAGLLGYADPRLSQGDFMLDVDRDWFLQPLRAHFGDTVLAQLMAEGAAWTQARAIEMASAV
ncbi:MAG: hypothetical protein JO190_06220, partial [Candidatus Eremiobacteraeota bacterium]|nr:hypothetical protein [Candidatus Eremiobacteraeota bacterium]